MLYDNNTIKYSIDNSIKHIIKKDDKGKYSTPIENNKLIVKENDVTINEYNIIIIDSKKKSFFVVVKDILISLFS